MAPVKLPKYVQAFYKSGKRRYYFRRRGFKTVPLSGEPWSLEFMSVYTLALAGEPLPIGRGRAESGSTTAIVLAYLASDGDETSFAKIKSGETKKCHRRTLERFSSRHGNKPFRLLDKLGVERVLDDLAETPAAKRNLRNVLRRMMKWGMAEKLIGSDPTEGIKITLDKSDGWHTMADAERAQFRAHHPIGTKARAAFELLFYTALRVSDACRLGPQHVRPSPGSNLGAIHLAQQKTGGDVTLPVHADMIEAVNAYPRPDGSVAGLAYLVNKSGKAYSAKGLANAFKDWCIEAGLAHCSAHSVRKGTLTMLAERSRTVHEIAAYGGHKSLRMVEAYTRKADTLKLTTAAAQAFEPEPGTQVSTVPVVGDKKGKKA